MLKLNGLPSFLYRPLFGCHQSQRRDDIYVTSAFAQESIFGPFPDFLPSARFIPQYLIGGF